MKIKVALVLVVLFGLLSTVNVTAGNILYRCAPPAVGIYDFIVWVQIPCVWLPMVVR